MREEISMVKAKDAEAILDEQIEKITLFINYIRLQQDANKRSLHQWVMEYKKPCSIYFMMMISLFLIIASITQNQYNNHQISKEKYLSIMLNAVPLLFIMINALFIGGGILMEAAGHGAPSNNFILERESFNWFKLLLKEVAHNHYLRNLSLGLLEEPSSMLRTEEACEILTKLSVAHTEAKICFHGEPEKDVIAVKNYNHLPFWAKISSKMRIVEVAQPVARMGNQC